MLLTVVHCECRRSVQFLCVFERSVVLAFDRWDVLHFRALVRFLVHVVVGFDVGHTAGVARHGSVVGFAGGVRRLTLL